VGARSAVRHRAANDCHRQDRLLSALPRHYATARASFVQEIRAAWTDIAESFKASNLWFALGLNDIVARYRGSIIGPFWITLTTAVFVLGVGFLYAGLMKVSVANYLPWMTTGVVVWGLISQSVLEGGDSLIAAGQVLRQTAIPVPLFVWRVVWRNLLTFCHQAPVLLIVAIKFGYLLRMNLPEAILGIGLVEANVTWFALFCAILCARFRDMQQILASLTQLLFFLSPVLWLPTGMRGLGGQIMMFNPVVHMLNAVRGPLIGQDIPLFSGLYLVGSAIVGWAFVIVFFSRVRRRIVHYV
jgi:lipopolysaccharide transport system permease protein